MKKIYITLLVILFLTSCNQSSNSYKLDKISFDNEGYECNYVDNIDKFCRIYFASTNFKSYVNISEKFDKYDENKDKYNLHKYDYDLIDGYIKPYSFEYNNYKFNNFKIKQIKNTEIQISNNIILTKQISQKLDKKFQGIFNFNDKLYEIKYDFNSNTASVFTSGYNEIANKYGILIKQLDENVISLSSSIISEYPLYFFEFNEDNDLILYPIIGIYDRNKRISYTLKRQN